MKLVTTLSTTLITLGILAIFFRVKEIKEIMIPENGKKLPFEIKRPKLVFY